MPRRCARCSSQRKKPAIAMKTQVPIVTGVELNDSFGVTGPSQTPPSHRSCQVVLLRESTICRQFESWGVRKSRQLAGKFPTRTIDWPPSDRCRKRQGDRERCPFVQLAFDVDRPPMHFDDPLDDREAESAAASGRC